jgi:peptide/nickel transport system substrate-binding protein
VIARRIALHEPRERANLAAYRAIGTPTGAQGPAPGIAAEEEHMRSSTDAGARSRLGRPSRAFLATLLLIAPTLLSAGGARAGTEDLILRVATDQKLESIDPLQSITYADYEVFQIQYELLVSFGPNLEAVPGFADEWSSSTDKMTHTFHVRDGMKWSDGQPATCADAEYTYQLFLDAAASETGYLGSGYLDPYLTNTGLTGVECDGEDFIATTEFPTTLLTQAYIPILPEHIWGEFDLEQIGNSEAEGYFGNPAPVVGSGPYVVTEFDPGNFVRMDRNPNYWGTPGVPDAIIFQQFSTADAMVQALKNGEVDYVRGTGANQYDALETEANVGRSEGYANGYTYLSFNTGGTKEGYKGSTSALEDQAFRDALGFAINRQELVDKVLNGHGVAGSTHVPPYHVNWHVEPTTPRGFDIAEANRRLDAAGYARGADDIRVDKDGKPINLRLTWPDSEDHSADAQFIQGWFEQIGIGVEAAVTEEGTLIEVLYGPDAGGDANWDFYIWGWGGDPDPMSLVATFTTDNIASGYNDCFYSDARYDTLFTEQQRATDEAARKTALAEMQNLFYDAACYHVLYYDSELHAYRTDKFNGWVNQPPETGTPFFGFGYSGYMALGDASAVPTPGPTVVATAPPAGVTPGPTAPPVTTPTAGNSTPLLIGGGVVLLLVVAGLLLMRRRGAAKEEE